MRYSRVYHSIPRRQRIERDLYPRNLYGKGWTCGVGGGNHLLYGDSTDEGVKCVQAPLSFALLFEPYSIAFASLN